MQRLAVILGLLCAVGLFALGGSLAVQATPEATATALRATQTAVEAATLTAQPTPTLTRTPGGPVLTPVATRTPGGPTLTPFATRPYNALPSDCGAIYRAQRWTEPGGVWAWVTPTWR